MLDLLLGYAVSEMLDDGVPRSSVRSAYNKGIKAGADEAYQKGYDAAKAEILARINGPVQTKVEWTPRIDVVMGAEFKQKHKLYGSTCEQCGSSPMNIENHETYFLVISGESCTNEYSCPVCNWRYKEHLSRKGNDQKWWERKGQTTLNPPSGPEYEAHQKKLAAEKRVEQETKVVEISKASWIRRFINKR